MDAPALRLNQQLSEIRARLVDPAASTDDRRTAVNDLMVHRHDPAAGALLDELAWNITDKDILWLIARAYGYLGRPEKLPSVLHLFTNPDAKVRINAFKSVVMLDRKRAVEEARALIIASPIEQGVEIAAIVAERCAEESHTVFQSWMYANEAELRIASLVHLHSESTEVFLEHVAEMFRREKSKSVVKVLRKQLVAKLSNDQANELRKLREELVFKLEQVQLALRQLSPVADPQSTMRTVADIARLLGADPDRIDQMAASAAAASSGANFVHPRKPVRDGVGAALPQADLDARFSGAAIDVGASAGPDPASFAPSLPSADASLPLEPAPPVADPPSRIQRTLNRLISPIFRRADRRGPDRRRAAGDNPGEERRAAGDHPGEERRAGPRRQPSDPYALPAVSPRAVAVVAAVLVSAGALLLRDLSGPDPAAAQASRAPDSPLGNVGATVDVTGEITTVDVAHDLLILKLEKKQVLEVHAPGGSAASYAVGQSVKVLGVIRQIKPDARVMILAFTIAKV